MEVVGVLAVVAVIVLLVVLYFKYQKKFPKTGSVTIITGAVKSGKTSLAVYLALRAYRRAKLNWKLRCLIAKLRHQMKPEMPLLYSNIPLTVDHVRITLDLLTRKKRFNYKSVFLLSEAALVCDSQMIRDKDLNNQLLLFWKLFAHEGRGSSCFLDTQSIQDNHYSVKRVCSSYLYVDRTQKFIPLFLRMQVIENRYSEDGTIVAVDTDDIENRVKSMLIPKSVWKKFDCYTYSCLTDDLDRECTIIHNCKDLKTRDIVSFDQSRLYAVAPKVPAQSQKVKPDSIGTSGESSAWLAPKESVKDGDQKNA